MVVILCGLPYDGSSSSRLGPLRRVKDKRPDNDVEESVSQLVWHLRNLLDVLDAGATMVVGLVTTPTVHDDIVREFADVAHRPAHPDWELTAQDNFWRYTHV